MASATKHNEVSFYGLFILLRSKEFNAEDGRIILPLQLSPSPCVWVEVIMSSILCSPQLLFLLLIHDLSLPYIYAIGFSTSLNILSIQHKACEASFHHVL